MHLSVREARESEYKQMIEMFREMAQFQNASEKMTNTVEKMRAERDIFRCLVAATDDGRIVGYAVCFYAYYTWTGKSLYMDDLYVKDDFRKQGVGRRLIQAVIEYAKANGCHKVKWQVSRWNTNAIGFYTKLGAEISETESDVELLLS